MNTLSDKSWEQLKARLNKSKFRSRFKLKDNDLSYIQNKGLETVKKHCADFISKRLSSATPLNDGKQTPLKGHPVFIAQHATATCCRSCLLKWHGIEKGKKLNEEEINYITNIIMLWIKEAMENI